MISSKYKKIKLDKQTTNTSFRWANNEEVKRVFELLRPGYKPPDRQAVADNLLDEVYNDIEMEQKTMLKNKFGCMAVDGWTNV